MPRLTVAVERFPIAGAFTISRGSRTEAVVVVATLDEGGVRGRGECVPYARYGESVESVAAALEEQTGWIAGGGSRFDLADRMKPGAARNALDCALWDFEAKRTGRPAHELAGLSAPGPVTTAYTLSLGDPEAMEEAARNAAHRPLLKVKLGGEGDPERIAAVRRGAPDSRLIVDANEAWRAETIEQNLAACAAANVGLIEQPLPAGDDGLLAEIDRTIPICADESLHDRAGLDALAKRYDAINIKLDKAGGLTEALKLAHEARARGFEIMVGCMVGSSLAMAPAMLLAHHAAYVDLDGPLLLARDREPGLRYEGSTVYPPLPDLWG
ncbi:Mandelate racemase/muconate lactonizing protein [Methylorubrum populi BJ001]|jgi:L-alanine-DL-glutamate epimerase-like enolase superfamily enzyme|uniref:Dipeptide epimerase n=1 Tax=Methylorubrum populi (strain ATCC BAA-705 / NCIMB 13946 / BJ001) TaxID=441620 RepID=B1ZDN6_METPB|nr:N-acetyl-D-Glu racemase DgcA [Methylorubrum populi]ACB80954.1 Mandelate racemase/muconate lactonizing protein [Methylorubrum populi BJ001]OAH33591.1 dipeptide epimerase [Methylorubrum populi]PZP73092.1 MAG: dipeptide epimerase [Methylorubrum populi]